MELGESGDRPEGSSALSFERPGLLSLATARGYARLRRSHSRTYEAVNRQRQERLRVMVSHARPSVPIYRELYAGLPECGPIDLERLPVVDKSTFRAQDVGTHLAGPRPTLSRTLRSSGTTGQPLAVEWSPRAAWWQGVLTLRMASRQGLSPIHRRAVLVGLADARPAGSGLFGALRRRHVHLALDQGAEALAQVLENLQPHAVFGHGHILVEIGEHLTGGWRPK